MCSEHLMEGALPVTHPDMSCVVATPSCTLLDLIVDELDDAEERRKLPALRLMENIGKSLVLECLLWDYWGYCTV